jgi:hypothetical protein
MRGPPDYRESQRFARFLHRSTPYSPLTMRIAKLGSPVL